MALLPPVSRPVLSTGSTLSTQRIDSASSPLQGPSASACQGSRQSNPLQKLLMSDGFDSPMGTKQAGGLNATVQLLSQVTELLAQSVRMLGGDLGAGNQALPGVGASSPGGVPDLGGAQAGVPDLGAEGGVPDLGGAEGGVPDLAAAPSAPEAQPEAAAESQAITDSKGAPKGERTMTFTNDGTTPMNIQFTPNAGEKEVPGLTLKPGETRTVEFPENWSGNFRSTAGDGKAATLGEVKFNGGGNQTYYDVSYIEGANAAMTIQPDSGGRKSGTLDNLLSSAPDAIKAKDGNGQVYGIKKTTTSNVQDGSVVDFYRKHVGADQGYVIPTDDASTLGSGDSHLTVHLKNLT